MLTSSVSIQHSFMSGVFLNEFLRCVKNLLGACDSLLGNARRNATDALGD